MGDSTKSDHQWQELRLAFAELDRLRVESFATLGQRGVFEFVERALENSADWRIVLELSPYLCIEYRQLLLPRLLEIACSRHSLTRQFADLVCSFQSTWLREQLERVAEPFLMSEEAYWQLFEIYSRIDRSMAVRLIEKARSSLDPDIRLFATEKAGEVRTT